MGLSRTDDAVVHLEAPRVAIEALNNVSYSNQICLPQPNRDERLGLVYGCLTGTSALIGSGLY